MADLSLAFDILARDKASGTFDKVGGSADGLSKKLAGVGKVAAAALGGAAVAAVAGFGAAVVQGVKDAVSYETITKQLAATLEATGNAAGTSVKDMQDLAGSLESLSGVDEELILNSQNVLATFKNISNNGPGSTFDEATKAALNLSTTMGGDLQGATVLVGKALNDPIKGLTALGRAGVGFTEDQKKMIKAMVEAGDTAGAQKIILGELEAQFGGAAKAAGSGFAGDLARLKDAFSDAFRELGTKILPYLADFASWLSDRLPAAIETVSGFLSTVGEHISEFWTALTTGFTVDEGGTWWENLALTINEDVLPVLKDVVGFIRDHLQPILGGLAAVLAGVAGGPLVLIGAAFVVAYTKSETFRDIVQAVVSWLKDTAWPAIQTVAQAVIDAFSDLAEWTRTHWASIQEAIGHVIAAVAAVIDFFIASVKAGWRLFGDDIIGFARNAWETIQGVIEGAVKAVSGIIEFWIAIINGDWGEAWEAVKKTVSGVWDAIKSVVSGALGSLLWIVKAGLDLVAATWSGAWDSMKAVFSGIWDAVKGIAGGVLGWIEDRIDQVMGAIRAVREAFDFGADLSPGSVVGGRTLGGGRALGGPVSPLKSYVVGERGPELFLPSTAGTIVPNGGSDPDDWGRRAARAYAAEMRQIDRAG